MLTVSGLKFELAIWDRTITPIMRHLLGFKQILNCKILNSSAVFCALHLNLLAGIQSQGQSCNTALMYASSEIFTDKKIALLCCAFWFLGIIDALGLIVSCRAFGVCIKSCLNNEFFLAELI
jgi:hypothetical protein